MVPASFIMPLFIFFVGPSHLFHFSNTPSLIGVGLFMGATSRAVIQSFTLMEAIKGASLKYPHL